MKVLGAASAIPERSVSSQEIEARLGLESGWIARRTGIDEHPTASAEEATSDLAIRAGAAAIERSGIPAENIGLVLLATSTPDHLLPPTAPLVAHRLGLQAGAVDLAGACSGFLYALVLGSTWTDSLGKAALIIGANILTRRMNPDDPSTTALFSDGAGAVVLGPASPSSLLSSFLGSDGSSYGTIGIPAGGSREPLTPESLGKGRNLMQLHRGASLFKEAVKGMAEAGKTALREAKLQPADIDWWIPHQANGRIIHDAGLSLEIAPQRTISVVSRYGNSSAATIPIALSDALDRGLIRPGQTLLLTAAGAGLLTAACILRW